ncbi:Phosphate transport system permease protein PstA (TC 3.A.1.7.1) [hydrothermal vent metagenome]|uniref:Phosphate transport system permease protein PstA (TC 3.A.1.7.1) n=1 Tax=hydrothermal vent metagenome TaxID=652676 RepID=A0A3B0UR42_9ZZZZ
MNNIQKNRLKNQLFKYWGIACTLFGLVMLSIFLGNIITDGLLRINWDFIVSLPSRNPLKAGIFTALMGSIWVLFLTCLFAFPLGVAAGVYLEEYSKKNKLAVLLEINISNLAGVPSIIYGLLGLEVFGRILGFGTSILTGSLTLGLLILPIIIVATRESIKAVPKSIKEASFAMGASKWQTVWLQTLPASFGGILTGVILALSRAVGEAAPLIVIGALAYVPFAPHTPLDDFSVLPIQIFNWISRPQHGFAVNAAAGIIILLLITFTMNGVAVYFRNKWQKKIQ